MLGGSSSECFIAETMELDYVSQILVPTSIGDANVIQFHPIWMTFSECLLCDCLRAGCRGSSGERLRHSPCCHGVNENSLSLLWLVLLREQYPRKCRGTFEALPRPCNLGTQNIRPKPTRIMVGSCLVMMLGGALTRIC